MKKGQFSILCVLIFVSLYCFAGCIDDLITKKQISNYLVQINEFDFYNYDVKVNFYTYEKCEKGANVGIAELDNLENCYIITTYDYAYETKIEWLCGESGVYPISKTNIL